MDNPKVIGPYRIVKKLGEGAFTEVFEAAGPQGTVALKIAKKDADEEERLLLKEEFTSLSNINHPNVVSVYDFGTAKDGRPFLTMELVSGRHFHRAFNRPSKPFFTALSQILSALNHIHYLGYIHGDIKPENILVSRKGRLVTTKLTDFAFVQNLGVTAPAVPKGTPGYMAPEIFTGMTPDARSDIYSLGVVIYETLTGRSPFDTGETPAILKDRLTRELEPISRWLDNVPLPLERILERMTRTKPENRPRDALEILEALKELLPEESLSGIEKTQRPLLSSSLVGRRRKLDHLLSLVKKTSRSRNAAALITGPPGIGKSRLLKELKRRAQVEGVHVFGASCTASTTHPLGPFSDLAQAEQGELGMPTDVFHEEKLSGQEQLIRQFELMSKYFSRISEELDKKLLIFLDDLELGDENVQSLFQYLSRYCRTRRGLACIAAANQNLWADTDQEKFEFELIELDPLSKAGTQRLVSNMLGLNVPLKLAQWVHRYSGGIPLLAEETVSWLYRNSFITAGDKCQVKWARIKERKPPRTIGALTSLLVKGLSEEELALLKNASVVGDTFETEVLKTLSGHDEKEFSALLRILRSRKLLQKEAGTTHSFTHRWVSTALYSRIPREEKKAAHRKVLKTLESIHPGRTYQLANHAEKSGMTAKTVRYSLAAAREAMKASSFDSSVEFFKLALSNMQEKVQQRKRIMEELADAQVRKGDHRAALSDYSLLCEGLRNRAAKARVCRKAAFSHSHLGEIAKAASLLDRARTLTENMHSKERTRILWLSGWIEHKRDNCEQARAYLYEALNLTSRLKDDRLTSRVYTALGTIELEQKQVSDARGLSLKAVSAARRCGNKTAISSALFILASSEIESGQLAQAASHLNEALMLERKANYLSGQGSCLASLALVEQKLGKPEEAIKHIGEALEIFKKIEENEFAAAAENNLGYFHELTGNWEKAREHYAGALARLRKMGHERWAAMCHTNLGLLEVLMGDTHEGMSDLGHALKLSESRNDWRAATEVYTDLSVALATQGKLKDALAKAIRSEQMAREKGVDLKNPLLQLSQIHLMLEDHQSAMDVFKKASSLADSDLDMTGRALRLEAQLFPESAEQSISESASIFQKLNDRFELAKTLLVQANLYAEEELTPVEGRPIDSAILTAQDAVDIFRSLGAKPYITMSNRQIAEFKKRARETSDTENIYLNTIFAVNKMVEMLAEERNMLDDVLDRVIDILGAQRGMVLLLDEEGNLLPAAGRNIDKQSEKDIAHISKTVVRNVTASGRPETSANALDDPRYMSLPSITLHSIKSLMCVPLISKGEPIGALYVDHTEARNLFTPYDDDFLITVGNLLAAAIDKSRYIRRLETQNVELKKLIQKSFSIKNIIGASPEMLEVMRLVSKFASLKQNVLITAERGTGKSLIAKALHFESPLRNGPFVEVDFSLVPQQLVEDALFGHVRGAFTGAYADSQGLIEAANHGTVLLDNVDSIPLNTQAKLVRPLQTGEIRRLGSTKAKPIDFRVVSATTEPLEKLVKGGQFRMDLFLILKVLEISLPPLRERRIDIYLLAYHFLQKFAATAGKRISGFSREALDTLASYSWPGNVTELEKCIERAVALCTGEVVSAKEMALESPKGAGRAATLESSRDFAELSELSSALIQCGGNVTHTARILGLSRRQVQRLLKKHSLLSDQFKHTSSNKSTHSRGRGSRSRIAKTKQGKNLTG